MAERVRQVETNARAFLEDGAVLRARVGAAEYADLIWEDTENEFVLTIGRGALLHLIEQGQRVLDVMARFAVLEAAGEDPERLVIAADGTRTVARPRPEPHWTRTTGSGRHAPRSDRPPTPSGTG